MEQLRTQVDDDQYRTAFGTIRAAKNWFWWLILACLVIQFAGFVLVRFWGVIDKAPAVVAVAADEDAATRADTWYRALGWFLPATKFTGMVSGMLLALTLLLAVKIALLGRAGGVAGFIGAFFWSLLLLVFLIPWQQVTRTTFASGALHNLDYLIEQTRSVTWNAKDVSWFDQVMYYARFVAYPLFVVLLQLVVQVKFARGHRRMSLSVAEAAVAEPPENAKM